MIKKMLALVLAFLMVLSIVGCSQTTNSDNNATNVGNETNISKEDEKMVTDALDEFLAKNYKDYEIVKIINISSEGEYEGKPLQYETSFLVKIDGRECNFLTKMVQDAPISVYTDLYQESILNEFIEFLDSNELMKSAVRKEYTIETFEGSTLLPAEIKTLDSLFEVAAFQKFNISATFYFQNKDKFNPESLNIGDVTEKFSNYKITLYNVKNVNEAAFPDQGSQEIAQYNMNLLDSIEYSMYVVDKSKVDEVVPSNTTPIAQKGDYEQFVSVIFHHGQFHDKGDITFNYDNRFWNISIEKIESDVSVPSDLDTENGIYRYEALGESYKIKVSEKSPCTNTLKSRTASYAIYEYTTKNNKVHTVTAYYDGLVAIYPLEEYEGAIPYYNGIVLPTEITNKNYITIDLSALEEKEFMLSFFKKVPNINT